MDTAKVDLDIVQTLNRFLEGHPNVEGESQRAQLSLIENHLREIIASGIPSSSEGRNLLKSLFEKPPSLLAEVSVETVREIIGFALDSCNHYSEIKSRRPLTEEEEQVGRELTTCVGAARKLLEALRNK
jgi:hypothetical protein